MPRPFLASSRRFTAAALLFVGCAVVAARADVVILKDGFVLQGVVSKEKERVQDQSSGKLFTMARAGGFDFVDEGPKVVFFSTHAKQLGEVSKEIKLRPDYRTFNNFIKAFKGQDPIPVGGDLRNISEWDDKWKRVLEIKMPVGTEKVEQQIVQLDPYYCRIVSPSHSWRVGLRTSELGAVKLRKLLSTHSELVEAPGTVDPLKRLMIAKFLMDAGFPVESRQELVRLKAEQKGEFTKDAQEAFDRTTRELDQAAAEIIANESEKFLAGGRYLAAADLLAKFPSQGAEPRTTDRATKLMATVKTNRERHEAGSRLLSSLIDEAGYGTTGNASLGVAGGLIAPVMPRASTDSQANALIEGANSVLAELHPDTVGRLELFLSLATQSESQRQQGRESKYKPTELLAAAISAWVKGKISTNTQIDTALRAWNLRTMALAYRREPGMNARKMLYDAYVKQAGAVSTDELVQVIRLLPPADPENLEAPQGQRVPPSAQVPERVLKYTATIPGRPRPLDYYVRLPLEYHHGRAYPVLMVLTQPGVPPESLLGGLAVEADRNGYILVAPNWDAGLMSAYDYDGDNHVTVTTALRETNRRFSIDNDRVFLFGLGEGANMALDVGLSHPDLFAGLLPWGPTPKWTNMFMYYWKNAQKLPIYAVTGEHAGKSLEATRALFNQWMGRGYTTLLTVYKGRQLEWYPAEVPVMFDWMGRRKRVSGAAFLNLGSGAIDTTMAFQTMRLTDDRFYWLGVEELIDRYRVDIAGGVMNARAISPAWVLGDIRNGNEIHVFSVGVKKVSIWLGLDMIDWAKPVKLVYNRQNYAGFKPQILKPDAEVLMEDFHRRGDRKQLVLYRIELKGN